MKCLDCGKKVKRKGNYCFKCIDKRRKEIAKKHYTKNRDKLLKISKINEERYKKNCIDCRKKIWRDSTRCKSCSAKMIAKSQGKIGRKIDKSGYILIQKPEHPYANSQKYVREHRIITEKKIGRFLKPEEVVHHIDGNTSNNDIDNLMLFPSQREHKKFEIKVIRYGYMTNPIRRQIQNRWKKCHKNIHYREF